MELDELKQGLDQIQAEGQEPAAQPWLGMDNLMGSYGSWFGNDKGLGELLLGQLRARGVDTQAATEAMLREILTTLTDDLNALQQRLTGFTQAVAQQVQEVNAVKDSVDTALAQSGGNPAAQEIGGAAGPDMGGAGAEPPAPPSEMPTEGGAPAPEAGGGMPPAEGGAPSGEEMPPEGAAPEEEPPAEEAPPEETVSDECVKKVKGLVLSDAGMKKIVSAMSKPRGMTFSPEMVAAARRF